MSNLWSEQAVHVVSLFAPWQAGDGYEEPAIVAAEDELGIRLPSILRSFYRSWGARDDLTRRFERLLAPSKLIVQADALIFCVETQAVSCWAVLRSALREDNPPVQYAEINGAFPGPERHLGPWQLSHERLTDFLDALTYTHAFAGGALHGGSSRDRPDESKLAMLATQWRRFDVRAVPFGLEPEAFPRLWPLYVREGQACGWWLWQFTAAARTVEDLDEISRMLSITWEQRW